MSILVNARNTPPGTWPQGSALKKLTGDPAKGGACSLIW